MFAGSIAFLGKAVPIEQKLVSIHVAQTLKTFGIILPVIKNQSLVEQAALADLAKNELLALRIKTAFLVYPHLAQEVLPMYGSNAQFQAVFEKYGEAALPAIYYFVSKPIGSIQWMSSAGKQYDALKAWFINSDDNTHRNADTLSKLTPVERGLHAINYIDNDQYDFIGQFEVDDAGEVSWILSERFLEALSQFFGSGVRELERVYKQDEPIGAADIGWASLDVLVFASAVKVLRVGKAAAISSQGAVATTRTAAATARAISGARLVLNSARYAKWPALIGASYIVFTHPSLINDVFAEVASLFGLPIWLTQFVGWLILLLPILWLLRVVIWFCAPVLKITLWRFGHILIALGRQTSVT